MKRLFLLLLVLICSNNILGQKEIKILDVTRPIIECNINGNKCYMLIDTGASLNIIDINSINDLGIKKKHRIGDILFPTGVSDIYRLGNFITKIDNIEITQFVGMDITNVIGSVESTTGVKIVGIIGTPAIRESSMIINLKDLIITIK